MLVPKSQEADHAALYVSTRPSERQPQPFCPPSPEAGISFSLEPSKQDSQIAVSLDFPWANRMSSVAGASPVRASGSRDGGLG